MTESIKTLFFGLLIFTVTALSANAQVAQPDDKQTLDRIVAVVNDHIILKSDVDQRLTEYLMQMRQNSNQQVNFHKDLWYTVLQNIIEKFVVIDQARVDSINVTEEEVDQAINRRIQQVVNQLGSEKAVEEQVGKSIVQLRADLRSDYRQRMIVQAYWDEKLRNVTISRREVVEYFNSIPRDSLPNVPEQVALSQIVKVPPPLENARDNARELAKKLRDSIVVHDKTFEAMAKKYSDGPSASNGGKLPLMNINELVAEYSAAATNLNPGEISEVVETSFGFHVIRLNRREGDKIDTNNLLISIDEESYDDQAAIDTLNALRDSVLNNPDITFAEMARKYSDDPNTSSLGGRILNPQNNERLIPLSQLDPALYRIALLLEEVGNISEPKPFTMGSGNNTQSAYRIVQLDRRIEEHTANLDQDYENIRRNALDRKEFRIRQEMLNKMKNNSYIEYRIPVPKKFKEET